MQTKIVSKEVKLLAMKVRENNFEVCLKFEGFSSTRSAGAQTRSATLEV